MKPEEKRGERFLTGSWGNSFFYLLGKKRGEGTAGQGN